MSKRFVVVAHDKLASVVPALLCVFLLLAAAAMKWPYSFYVLLRIITCVSCVYMCSRVLAEKRATIWAWVMGAIAFAYNPLFPLRMSRADWRLVNLVTCIPLGAWIVWMGFRREPRES